MRLGAAAGTLRMLATLCPINLLSAVAIRRLYFGKLAVWRQPYTHLSRNIVPNL
jgi:hypothetical protein